MLSADEINAYNLKDMNMKYAAVYNYDNMQYTEIDNLEINWDTLIEARIFNEEKEIHIFKDNDNNFKTAEIKDSDFEDFKDVFYLLKDDNFKKLGVRKYISYDKDDQAYFEYARPFVLEKK